MIPTQVIAEIQALVRQRPHYDFLTALMSRAINTPDEEVVINGDLGFTAPALLIAVIRYTIYFDNVGIRRKQIIGFQCHDRLSQILVHSALLALGAVRKLLTVGELQGNPILQRCDFVISDSEKVAHFPEERLIKLDQTLETKIRSIPINEQTLKCWVNQFFDDDPIVLGNTSATTGERKYFFNTRRIMSQRTKFIYERYFSGHGKNFIALYDNANVSSHVAETCALMAGGKIVYSGLDDWASIAKKFPDSHALILPRDVGILSRLHCFATNDQPPKIHSLRVLGGSLGLTIRVWLESHVAEQVVNSYSSNEMGQIAELDSNGIGQIYAGVSVKITDVHQQPLPIGTPGTIALKTAAPIESYLWNAELNAQSFQEGWYFSSDFGKLIDEQTIQLLGRTDDILNLGGIKVAPRLYEEQIRQIDGVSDCALFVNKLSSDESKLLVCVESSQHNDFSSIQNKVAQILPFPFGTFDLLINKQFPITETRKVRRNALLKMARERLSTIAINEDLKRAKAFLNDGKVAAAQALCINILKTQPIDFEALNLLGVIRIQLEEPEEGVRLIAAALKISPSSARAYYNLGNGLLKLNRPEDALVSYDMALLLHDAWPELHCNRGTVLLELNRHEEALASLNKAISLQPDYAEALYNRGNLLLEMACFDDALSDFDAALKLNSNDAESWSNRGNALSSLHRWHEGLASYDQALRLNPDSAEILNNRANLLKDLKRFDEALVCLDQAIALKPDYPAAWQNRGNVLVDLKFFNLALASYERALSLNPEYEFLEGICLHTRMQLCLWDGWQRRQGLFTLALKEKRKITTPFPCLALSANPDLQKQAAQIYSERLYSRISPFAQNPKPQWHEDLIRIAYISCDFKEHAVSYLMAGVFEAHDRERFEVYGYDIGPAPDSHTRRRVIAAFDHFKIVSDLSDRAVAEQIRQDQIDILIDLTGYTKGARTGIFAYRPAPIQVNYLGFPGTMGAPFMDYIIADRVLIPEESRQYYTEQVLYLPHCFQANDDKRVIASPKPKSHFGLPEEAFVFGCFNQSAKFTPTLFEVWLSVLRHVPDSVLWLIEDNPTQVKNLRTYTQERGVDPNRLIFAKKLPYPEHLARYGHIDLVLDTLPFNGGTTTSDALWGGAPVLTCIGQTFAGRMSASLLTAIGLPELITDTLEDYERLAIDLATNPEQLKALRQRLGKNRTECPVFDTAAFTTSLETELLCVARKQTYE